MGSQVVTFLRASFFMMMLINIIKILTQGADSIDYPSLDNDWMPLNLYVMLGTLEKGCYKVCWC